MGTSTPTPTNTFNQCSCSILIYLIWASRTAEQKLLEVGLLTCSPVYRSPTLFRNSNQINDIGTTLHFRPLEERCSIPGQWTFATNKDRNEISVRVRCRRCRRIYITLNVMFIILYVWPKYITRRAKWHERDEKKSKMKWATNSTLISFRKIRTNPIVR